MYLEQCVIKSEIAVHDSRCEELLPNRIARYNIIHEDCSKHDPNRSNRRVSGRKIVEHRYKYFETNKGTYGFPQAGIMKNKLQNKRPSTYGFIPTPRTPGLWGHRKISIQFALVVDEFGVEYKRKEDT